MPAPQINELVQKTDPNFVLKPEEVVKLVFERNVSISGQTKTIRAKFQMSFVEMKKICEQFGISTAGKWEYWNKDTEKNLPYTEN